MSGAPEAARSYRLLRGGRVALEIRGEPGPLVSTSHPPPLPGVPPVTHSFATATFQLAESEGDLGALLRGSSDLDAFLEAAGRTGYVVESIEPAHAQLRRLLPAPAARSAGVTGGSARLVTVGRSLFAMFTTDPVVNVIELPDGLGVCLVHAVRGGGKIYVAPDESALFVGSAVDFDAGLGRFRDGVRTPIEELDASDGSTGE
ncbi:hypothetical protein OG373_01125 [Streptomyces avidinii]|uniref:hypothetical protein n=1 Tax=Streptomyces avidinii TaxID=1895 RepID=UPI003862DD85|nr:hypothetical protein OG373_01125 [Streptomyces avidinii]